MQLVTVQSLYVIDNTKYINRRTRIHSFIFLKNAGSCQCFRLLDDLCGVFVLMSQQNTRAVLFNLR